MKRIILASMVFGLFSAITYGVMIDFDSLNTFDVVTDQFSEATFSTEAGFQVTVRTGNLGSSLPNFICTDPFGQPGAGTPYGCANDIFIDFREGVRDLTFLVVGDDDFGVTGQVNVFVAGVFAGTEDIITDGLPRIANLVDLTGYSEITRIEIHSVTDFHGLGFDDFAFIPEPSTLLLLTLGSLYLSKRRKNN